MQRRQHSFDNHNEPLQDLSDFASNKNCVSFSCVENEKKNEMNLFSFLLDFFSSLSGVHIVNSSVTNLLFLLPFFFQFSVFVINRLRCCQLKMNKKSSFQLSSACFCSFSLHLFSASCDLITNNGIVYHVHTAHYSYAYCDSVHSSVTVLDTRDAFIE